MGLSAWLLVNATPLGINEPFPMNPRDLGVGLVLDLAYVPKGDTHLIRLAREYSIPHVDGLEILVRQALEADRIWFGGDIERPTWKEILLRLRGGEYP